MTNDATLVGTPATKPKRKSVGQMATAPAGYTLAPSAREATPDRDPLTGYTIEQIRTVFEILAGRASTLHHLLMMAQRDTGSYESEISLDAAVILATEIGATADSVLGGEIVGDRDHWVYGPNFATAGKAVQA